LEADIWKTEVFGPVIAIHTFETEEEALAIANDSSAGLAAYVCTQDLGRTMRVSKKYVVFLHKSVLIRTPSNDEWNVPCAMFNSHRYSILFHVFLLHIFRLECGIVGVNEGIISTCAAPFGGVKESGLGREGSSMGLAEYLETKYVFINY
jgi:succinate-semialdehyde dehydrogenase/glutarate-semialdehyde dehydrogenase